ncbi:MAG: hypothetical protein ACI92S_002513, partial [Planctomycetaceae bacterium]
MASIYRFLISADFSVAGRDVYFVEPMVCRDVGRHHAR